MARVDSVMVERMKAAGCIVIGKTNMPEFGLGSHTYNTLFGATGNAWDPSVSAGGSSGGAAVALAQRLLPVADGSDFMGSLRNPAAWNHVFGLRPSQGRVPYWPAADAWVAQLGTEGPMARTVRDLAKLLSIQAGHDPRAPLSIAQGPQDFVPPADASLRGARIALARRPRWPPAAGARHRGACERALQAMADAGARRRAAVVARRRPRPCVAGLAGVATLAGGAARRGGARAARRHARADQARGAVGVRPGAVACGHRVHRAPARRARASMRRCCRCCNASMRWRCRWRRCGRSTCASGGRARSPAARWTPTTAGWR